MTFTSSEVRYKGLSGSEGFYTTLSPFSLSLAADNSNSIGFMPWKLLPLAATG